MSPASGRRPRGTGTAEDATSGWEGAGRGYAARLRAAGGADAADPRGDRTTPTRSGRTRTDPKRTDPTRADPKRTDRRGTDPTRADRAHADPKRADPKRAGPRDAAAGRTAGTRRGRRDRSEADRTPTDGAPARTGRPTRGRREPDAVPAGSRTPPGGVDAGAGPDQPATAPGRRRWWRRPRRAGGSTRPDLPVPVHIRRRRRAAALAAVLALLVGVGVGTWVLLSMSGLADVQDVTVTGLSTVPEQAVRDAAAVPDSGPLIAVDTVGIASRVSALEGVASVTVRRAWPHTVEVDVIERVPVALWPTPQAVFEVDGTGLPYRRAPDPPPALPRLTFGGVAPQDPSTGAALAVLHGLTDPLRARVATVEVAGTKVTLGLADGRSVRWGDPDRTADKDAVLAALLGQPGSVYDVSSPDLPTVRP